VENNPNTKYNMAYIKGKYLFFSLKATVCVKCFFLLLGDEFCSSSAVLCTPNSYFSNYGMRGGNP